MSMSARQEVWPQEPGMNSRSRKIHVQEIMRDIRARLSDTHLMAKYDLSQEQLRILFRKLLDCGALSPFDFQAWAIFCNKNVPLQHIRLFRREIVCFSLPVFNANDPEDRGMVVDISENGIGVRGLKAVANDIKTLVIPTEQYLGLPPLVFQARCVWTFGEADPNRRSGFYLIDASAKIWLELRKYVRNRAKAASQET